MKHAKQEEPDALRRADHRLDGRARGAAAARAAADRGGDLQPPQRGHAARDRRHDPLPRRTTGRGRCASPSSARRRPTTRACAAACRRRRSATPASPRSRRPRNPAKHEVPVLRAQARQDAASTRSPATDAQFERDVARYQASRGGLDDLPGRLRVAGRPLALAGDAERRAARRPGSTTGATCALPLPPELFAETVRALPAAGFRGVNVTIPHKEAALAVADEATEAARAIGAANTLTFERDGAIVADNTDAPGLLAALCAACRPPGRRALVLGAGGAARAAVWALVQAGAADVAVWNRTPRAGAGARRTSSARAPCAAPGCADIVVNCTSVGLRTPRPTFKALPLRADELGCRKLRGRHGLPGRRDAAPRQRQEREGRA